MKTWYSIKSQGATAVLSVYDEVGAFGVSAATFIEQLAAIGDVRTITLLMNSPGGSVQDGAAIYNALKSHPARVIVEITGWALSIASYIAMAGDTIRIADNALMMIHAPWLNASGNSDELRKSADVLDKAASSMVSAYEQKSGKSKAQIIDIMAAETWFTASEAQAAGFADEIISPHGMAASFDPSRYHAIPTHLKGRITMPTSVAAQTVNTPADPNAAAILAADQKRRADIKQSFAKSMRLEGADRLLAACQNDPACTVDQANTKLLELYAFGREPIASNYVPDMRNDCTRLRDFKAAAADTLLMRAGVQVPDPSPACRDLKRHNVLMMAESILSLQGRSTRDMSRSEVIKAALSTSDFPALLADTAGKALRLGYESEPGTHSIWTAEREVPDFKKQTLLSLSEAPGLLEVVEHGEYKSGSFGEGAESFTVKTYGRVLEITRQMLVNDDTSAFTQLPSAFGAASRRLEADMVYERLTGSQTMNDGKVLFHADHGNLANTGSALSIDSLGAARAAMRKQKGISGVGHIDPQPRYLIVPVALETKAEQLISSIVVPSAATNATVAWIQKLQVVADPRLDAVSETAWYLAASPAQIDTIVRAYLAGQPRPYYEEREEFIRDVFGIKCRLDFGVGVIDWRGLYRNPGA
ncbi:MAG TPA: ClpP-like prohead protease/major capsid protein fusion protein [Rhodocyclaceae bacterium]|nr:ClpP-like prohead protease/major capsid protein fusion protein [Rhodocyclaceae bacterium]